MKNNRSEPDRPQINEYPWQREIEYSIWRWGRRLLDIADYTQCNNGEFKSDMREELVQELSLAILDAGKVSGNQVQGDPYSREAKLNPHVVEICKYRVWKIAGKATDAVEWPNDPAEARELDGELDEEASLQPEEEAEEEVLKGTEELDPEVHERKGGSGRDVRDNDGRRVRISLVPLDEQKMLTLADPNCSGERDFSTIETGIDVGKLDAFLDYLSDAENDVIVVRYLSGETEVATFDEVAKELGIHERQVRRIHDRALAKLRKWMADNISEEVSSDVDS